MCDVKASNQSWHTKCDDIAWLDLHRQQRSQPASVQERAVCAVEICAAQTVLLCLQLDPAAYGHTTAHTCNVIPQGRLLLPAKVEGPLWRGLVEDCLNAGMLARDLSRQQPAQECPGCLGCSSSSSPHRRHVQKPGHCIGPGCTHDCGLALRKLGASLLQGDVLKEMVTSCSQCQHVCAPALRCARPCSQGPWLRQAPAGCACQSSRHSSQVSIYSQAACEIPGYHTRMSAPFGISPQASSSQSAMPMSHSSSPLGCGDENTTAAAEGRFVQVAGLPLEHRHDRLASAARQPGWAGSCKPLVSSILRVWTTV